MLTGYPAISRTRPGWVEAGRDGAGPGAGPGLRNSRSAQRNPPPARTMRGQRDEIHPRSIRASPPGTMRAQVTSPNQLPRGWGSGTASVTRRPAGRPTPQRRGSGGRCAGSRDVCSTSPGRDAPRTVRPTRLLPAERIDMSIDPATAEQEYDFFAQAANQVPQGPPRRRSRRLSAPVPVRFSPEVLQRVRERADADDRSVSSWIRRAVENELGRGA